MKPVAICSYTVPMKYGSQNKRRSSPTGGTKDSTNETEGRSSIKIGRKMQPSQAGSVSKGQRAGAEADGKSRLLNLVSSDISLWTKASTYRVFSDAA